MHIMSHGSSGGQAGRNGHACRNPPPLSRSSSTVNKNSVKNISSKKHEPLLSGSTVIAKGKGKVYKIGKQKFTLDGKDGKTLDDVIEVMK